MISVAFYHDKALTIQCTAASLDPAHSTDITCTHYKKKKFRQRTLSCCLLTTPNQDTPICVLCLLAESAVLELARCWFSACSPDIHIFFLYTPLGLVELFGEFPFSMVTPQSFFFSLSLLSKDVWNLG